MQKKETTFRCKRKASGRIPVWSIFFERFLQKIMNEPARAPSGPTDCQIQPKKLDFSFVARHIN
jgi:hypothetical protein